MYKGISIETIHYAHICIVQDTDRKNVDFVDEINNKVDCLIAEYIEENQISDVCVEVDAEFRCNALTEVGLRGESLKAVQAVAINVARWADEHKELKLIG